MRCSCGMPASTGCSLEQVVPGYVPIIPDAWISLISPRRSPLPLLDSTILPKFLHRYLLKIYRTSSSIDFPTKGSPLSRSFGEGRGGGGGGGGGGEGRAWSRKTDGEKKREKWPLPCRLHSSMNVQLDLCL